LAAAAERHKEHDVCGGDGGKTALWWWWWLRRQLSSDARAFEQHRHADVRAFVLGRGRRDDGADCIIVGNSGARGDCCNCAAAVALCTSTALRAAATAADTAVNAVPPPSFRQRRAGVLPCSVLQEQDEAIRARRYRFLKQNKRKKLTLYLELKKIQ